jgi:hypothetical protein
MKSSTITPLARHHHTLRRLPLAILLAASFAGSASAGEFVPTGDMVQARLKAVATPLADGRVLITGGRINPATTTATAEIYDPSTGTFSATGAMNTKRMEHNAVLLEDGKVLVFSGGDFFAEVNGQPPTPAELYDPATGVFTQIGPMVAERYVASAARLADGRVLIVGGRGCSPCADLGGGVLATQDVAIAEIYDPATGLFTKAGPMSSSRGMTTLTALPDGRALVAGGMLEEMSIVGGVPTFTSTPLATAELFDPQTDAFTMSGDTMSHARNAHVAAPLPDGRVLLAYGALEPDTLASLSVEAEFYDPQTDMFTPGHSIRPERPIFNNVVTLTNGDVLFAGGDLDTIQTAELYDVSAGEFVGGMTLQTKHAMHITAPLPDGSALVASGLNPDNVGPLPQKNAEIYVPDAVADAIFVDGFESPPTRAAVGTANVDEQACSFAIPAFELRGASTGGTRVFNHVATGETCVWNP